METIWTNCLDWSIFLCSQCWIIDKFESNLILQRKSKSWSTVDKYFLWSGTNINLDRLFYSLSNSKMQQRGKVEQTVFLLCFLLYCHTARIIMIHFIKQTFLCSSKMHFFMDHFESWILSFIIYVWVGWVIHGFCVV